MGHSLLFVAFQRQSTKLLNFTKCIFLLLLKSFYTLCIQFLSINVKITLLFRKNAIHAISQLIWGISYKLTVCIYHYNGCNGFSRCRLLYLPFAHCVFGSRLTLLAQSRAVFIRLSALAH